MKKVLVSGCNGKMGQILCRMIAEDPNMEVMVGVDVNTTPNIHYPVFDSPAHLGSEFLGKTDVIIDFSSHEATSSLIHFAILERCPLVIATTGISEDDEAKMKKAAKEIPIFYSANMSYDVCAFKQLIKAATNLFWTKDIEIAEMHHKEKKDSPSGTAIMLAKAINGVRGGKMKTIYGREDKRENNEIGISSIRGGNIYGTHTVLFIGENDVVEIKHTSLSRDAFAEGAIRAAKFITEEGREPGLYTMDDLF